MNFLDGHLFPENQQPLIITAAPYAPSWVPSDFPEDIPVTMAEQVQKAVDCYNAGATVLHLHVRELDGKGSKRLSKFNELIAGVRARVPEMIIQVGGSISRNDPLASFDEVAAMAADWGSQLADAGEVGHLNPTSGYGPWPDAKTYIQQLPQAALVPVRA